MACGFCIAAARAQSANCHPHPVVVDAACTVELHSFRSPDFDHVDVTPPDPNNRIPVSQAEMTCDSCGSRLGLECSQSLCVTVQDSGSVSSSVSVELGLEATVNQALGGALGIRMTPQFQAGSTSTTTVSWTTCTTCTVHVPGCKTAVVRVYGYVTPCSARLPIHDTWYDRTTCPDGYDSGWVLNTQCPGIVDYATIDAMKGSSSGCISHDEDCPRDSGSPCFGEEQHGQQADPNALVSIMERGDDGTHVAITPAAPGNPS